MNAYAVDLAAIAVLVRTDGAITRLPFRTKRQADEKILELIQAGYTFDPQLWAVYNDGTPGTSIEAAKRHHATHGDMDGHTCLLGACALHYPGETTKGYTE